MAENKKQSVAKIQEKDSGSFTRILMVVGIGTAALALLGYVLNKWTETKDYLYHYTTNDAIGSIKTEMCIRQSRGSGDIAFGEGVYLTSLHPEVGPVQILENNYDGAANVPQGRQNHADSYVRFNKTDLQGVEKQNSDRDVWVCRQEIDLKRVPHDFGH